MLADFLYSLLPQEAASQAVLQRVATTPAQTRRTAAATQIQLNMQVPRDKAFWITWLSCRLAAGVAQLAQSLTVSIVDEGGNLIDQLFTQDFTTQNAVQATAIREVLLMPLETLRINSTFDAGAANNVLITGLHGFLIPRGSLQMRNIETTSTIP